MGRRAMEPGETIQGKAGYHHGDLRKALLVAAEEELTEKGIEGFSLRGVAKRAGVSHAAPAHHFRDTGDMLTALATIAFERLTTSMKIRQAEAAPTPRAQFIASGVGYIEFAIANRALFMLMFGSDRPDAENAALECHATGAFMVLVDAVRDLMGRDPMTDEAGLLDIAAAWSLVHGVANLLIAGRIGFLKPMLERDFRGTLETLIARVAPGR